MIFSPSESSKNITEFYKRYLLTTFGTNNEKYNNQLKEKLNEDKSIADGPYISMSDPYTRGKKIIELVEEGLLSKEILNLKSFYPYDRNLYKHQEEAIRKFNEKKNIVLTTGTGSGKTESFLIPIINELLKEKENGTLNPGVRCLIIYPMNALVNDQIRRIRELLYDMDPEEAITFGKFTGETEEYQSNAEKAYTEVEDINIYPWRKNEIISREKMRLTPPNILITNYAMLEYILLRPGDNIILEEQYANNWKYIVLDEAHSYNGANGIEVATLLKRVNSMLHKKNMQYVLTSATLGDEKSDKYIIEFANSLCNSKFEKESIIRSYTEQLKPEREIIDIDLELYKELAKGIRNNKNESELINLINSKYNNISGKNLEEKIFDLILHDKFYYSLRNALYQKIKSLNVISKELNINVNDFTDFITVSANAIKDGNKLFETKYHMFLRGIEGIFVTLKPLDKLFINKMETYKEDMFDDNDIGYKVFEITYCNNCNALFITGQTKDGFLVQNQKFSDDYSPEVYLLSGEYDSEDIDNENEDTYQICARCGEIKRALSVNGLQCNHGEKFINKLIKVKAKGEKLHKCPCCHSSNSQTSILRPYHLGNEAATAVIATALYNELPSVEYHKSVEVIKDDFFGLTKTEKEENSKISKQFLTFSDSRQTAAFFASYLESTYKSSLIKRIMYEISVENSEKFKNGMSLEIFSNFLTDKLKKYNALPYETESNIQKEAWIQILLEMSNYKARNSLLKNGFLKFEVDIDFDTGIDSLGLSAQETTELFKEMVVSFYKDAAVDSCQPFTEADVKRFTFSGFQKGYDLIENSANIESWCPEEGKTNKRLKYLTKVLGGDEITARKFLKSIWHKLLTEGIIKQVDFRNDKKPYQLNIEKIKVKSIDKLYICNECKSISAYNIRNKCDNPRCNGNLVNYDYKSLLKDNHYYNLYTKLDISPMVVREHTAQLSSETAYEYQKSFKNKDINILSCSTTFEMGVDVGTLETVFMRNMPPSPANYVQRAGRAGRTLKSAAYAITFCPNNSHDLNYYKNPTEMIEGKIVPPVINLSNEKIVLRHIIASAFSYYWKSNKDMYKKKIGDFVEANGFEKMKEYIFNKPTDLEEYIKLICPMDLYSKFLGINENDWKEKLFNKNGKDGIADIALNKFNSILEELNKEYDRRSLEHQYTDWIKRSITTIKDQRTIDFLSKNNIIPKYGFPVDTVELMEPSKITKYNKVNNKINLSRDLISAISEYAPESEVVADGKLYKSRYIKKIAGYEWPKYNYFECPQCNTLTVEPIIKDITECKQCGNKVNMMYVFLIPKFGFVLDTEGPKDVGINKPEKTYRGSISYIGDGNNINFSDYKIGNQTISIGNSRMDSLAVLNKSDFYVCEACGFSKVSKDFIGKKLKIKHISPSGYSCDSELYKYALGHEFLTDVVFIKFRDAENMRRAEVAWTVLYSLLEGLCRALDIDRKELSGCIQWYRDNSSPFGNYGCILFDNTPGGAGYVRKLENKDIFMKMLMYGKKVVSLCTCGGNQADTVCYSCLCNYYNQRQHEIMKRIYAIDFYNLFFKDDNTVLEIEDIKLDNAKYDGSVEIEIIDLKFENQGIYQESSSLNEIWQYIIGDCDNQESVIISKLARKTQGKNIEHPIYNEIVINPKNGDKIFVNEIWKEKKVMLFLTENYDDYLKALKTGWKCFCTKEKFDVDELIKLIEV